MAAKRKRRNIMMLDSVYEVAQGLMRERHMGDRKFSEFLSDLVMEARDRRASGDDKAPKQYLAEMLELLAKNRALEAKLKEKTEGFKLERKGLVGALALCETELKEARASARAVEGRQ